MGRADEIGDICERYLSRREERDKVQEIVERCIKKGYDYEKMESRLMDAVSDSQKEKAKKVLKAVCDAYPQLRKRTRFAESKEDNRGSKRERTERDVRGREKDDKEKAQHDSREKERERDHRDRKRKGEVEDEEERAKERERELEKEKRKQLAQEILQKQAEEMEKKKTVLVTEETLRAKEAMFKAQQLIEDRKRQLGMQHQPGLSTPLPAAAKNVALAPQEAQMFFSYSMDKTSRVEELKAKLAANKTVQSLVKLQPMAPVMAPLPEVPIVPVKPETDTNIESNEFLEFLDPRIELRPAERKRRPLKFHEKDDFVKLAHKQRVAAKMNILQAGISQAAKSTGISSAVKLAMVTPAGKSSDTVPDCEWWDTIVLDKSEGGETGKPKTISYDDIPDTTDEERFSQTISELVEHPIKMKAPNDPLTPQYLKVYLTSKERKKIRRQNRKEMQKEITEKIRLGLEKAPEAKVKISNLMRVLGSDAIQDPTKMESHVRKQMADRLKKHQLANAERKLTDEQKAAKKTKKISEDTSLATSVAVYRIKSLLNPAKKFKVETNAKQLQMTGMVLMHKQINVVVVEGGPKQQKFYKNLMMSRIKWGDEVIGQKKDAEKDAPGERNDCQLIWEGQVKKRNFKDFTVVTATLEKQARERFENHGVAQYWDLAYSTSVLHDDQDSTNA